MLLALEQCCNINLCTVIILYPILLVGYKYELALVLNGTVPIPDFSSLEQEVFRSFRKPPPPSPLHTSTFPNHFPLSTDTPRTRDGRTKTHFNYLLLDPRKVQGLSRGVVNLDVFRTFVESIFYVGKGKNARSLQHLKDAKECLKQQRTKVHMQVSEQPKTRFQVCLTFLLSFCFNTILILYITRNQKLNRTCTRRHRNETSS